MTLTPFLKSDSCLSDAFALSECLVADAGDAGFGGGALAAAVLATNAHGNCGSQKNSCLSPAVDVDKLGGANCLTK